MGASRERRKNLRVQVNLEAVMSAGKMTEVQGICKNISAKGMYFECNPQPALDSICQIVIRLGDARYYPSVKLQGKVVRIDDQGVGLTMTGIDFKDYEHLKNVIIYSAEDPETAEKEFAKYLDLYRI